MFFSFQEVVTGILPISYEDEIVQKRTQILRDPLQALLVFPEDDVKVSKSFIICFFFSSTVRLNVFKTRVLHELQGPCSICFIMLRPIDIQNKMRFISA